MTLPEITENINVLKGFVSAVMLRSVPPHEFFTTHLAYPNSVESS